MRLSSATGAKSRRGLFVTTMSIVLAGTAMMLGSRSDPSAGPGAIGAEKTGRIAAPAKSLPQLVSEQLRLHGSEVVELPLDAGPGEPLSVAVPIRGRTYTIDLDPHSVRAAGYRLRVQLEDGSIVPAAPGVERTLRGSVREVPGSTVGASLLDDGLYATIVLPDGDTYWIEPVDAALPGARPDHHAVYHSDDIIPTGGQCAVTDEWMIEQAALGRGALPFHDEHAGHEGAHLPPGPLPNQYYCAEIACDADYYYFLDYGSVAAVEDRINTVINAVNTQYQDDVQISHVITEIIVRTSQTYTTNGPEQLLNQFRSRWLTYHGDVQRDVAHLFTGRNLSGNVIGIAWLSAICTSYGFGLVESDCCGSFGCTTDLSAHEIGHNWSADHCSCSTYTMNPSLTCSNRFQPNATIPEIVSFRNSIAGCLELCNPDGPENDNCGSNIEVFEGVTVFSTEGATTDGPAETGCDFVGGSQIESDIWFRFNPLQEAEVTISLCGSLFDTTLAVYAGCPDGPGEVIACNDDFCGEQSEVTFVAPQLFNLQVRIGSASGEEGEGLMNITMAPLSDCPADFDEDGDVDTEDLLTLLGAWGTAGPDGDIDEDGDVDTEDLLALLAAWGDC
ncbi:MAG: M12 family metallo-peptidase [Planctomycetota bacterium]|nr:M12 family metallo-peptidase [Planctomycetota bacterium]